MPDADSTDRGSMQQHGKEQRSEREPRHKVEALGSKPSVKDEPSPSLPSRERLAQVLR